MSIEEHSEPASQQVESLREALARNYAELSSEGSDDGEAVSKGAEPTEVDAAAEAPDADQPDAAKVAAEAPTDEPEPDAAEAPSEEDATLSDKADLAFNRLPLSVRKELEGLPVQDKEAVIDRLAKMSDAVGNSQREIAAWNKTLEPFAAGIEKRGLDARTAISQLLVLDARFNADPKGTIKMLGEQIGLSVEDASDEFSEFVDPQVQSVKDQTAAQNQEIARLTAKIEAMESRTDEQVQQSAFDTLEVFVNATDASGNLAHPHFDEVKADMHMLLSADRAENYEQAYKMAVGMNVDIQEAAVKAKAESAEAARKAKVEKAKKAGERVKGSSPAVDPVVKGESLRDTIKRNYAALSS
jgi:hypothetical protein